MADDADVGTVPNFGSSILTVTIFHFALPGLVNCRFKNEM